ncbi:MAG: hypothetical protein K5908_04515 [Erysipelotrichaceae bacterium]|nr:hypothetical protein [Erysipelotrichaceae bacterium]
MADYEDLVNGYNGDDEGYEEYLLNFFQKKNLKGYSIAKDAGPDSVKAIRTMFESRKPLQERVDLAFSYDPLCLEAFFVYFIMTEDVFLDYRFRSYYEQIGSYGDLGSYQRAAFIRIMEYYTEFLLDIRNYTRAAKVQRTITRLTNRLDRHNCDRLAVFYARLEEADDFYRLYTEAEDFSVNAYIMLVVTLLKHDDERRAKEVANDMFDHIELSSYIDHLWDLDYSDPAQKEFYEAVENSYEYIRSIPDFFTFMNIVREKRDGTI